MNIVERWYQTEAEQAIFDYFAAGNSGNPIVALPTGTGKSIVIGKFIHRVLTTWPDQRIIMATHVKELIEQNANKLLDVWPTAPIGIHSAGLSKRDCVEPVIYAGIQSVVNQVENLGKRDLLLVDECHLISGKEDSNYGKLIAGLRKRNPNLRIIGFTATKYRMGQGLLSDGPIFTDVCYDLTNLSGFNRLLDEGFLCQLIPKQTKTELNVSDVKIQAGDYIQRDLQQAVDKDSITLAACKEMVEQGANRGSWLVFATGVEHAIHVADCLTYLGIEARAVHSKMDAAERDSAIAAFKDRSLQCIVNNNILTTGFDHPALDLIGMLRPTASTALWVQMLGRGTRPSPETQKENCLVLDFASNTKRLGPINDPVIPKKRGSKDGVVPIRICDACGTYNHARATQCICCGAKFEAVTKIVMNASTAELIKRDDKFEIPQFMNYPVKQVFYFRHQKNEAATPAIKVQYVCGLQAFTEWVFIQHTGFPGRKAHRWWNERMPGYPVPSTVDQALNYISQLRKPREIRVWVNRKHPEVVSATF